ncbi:MAG: class I mannose-6-phosphate isomerase [Chitinophagaceae bacterium]
MNQVISNYDKSPYIKITTSEAHVQEGWEDICTTLLEKLDVKSQQKQIVVLDCYHGVLDEELVQQLTAQLPGVFYYSKECMLAEAAIRSLVYPDVTDDEVFGYLTRLEMINFFDTDKLQQARRKIANEEKTVYIYGPGASLLAPRSDLLIYFDMPRWEIQLRFRANEIGNLGLANHTQKTSLQYKQAFFVDWRVCDRHKKTLMQNWDFIIDTTVRQQPVMVSGAAYSGALQYAVTRPFRLVPFFDPGPWGGQWIKEYCDMDRSEKNYAWGFDCVPEENSLLFAFNGIIFETPAINLVFAAGRKLLGEPVQARFGDEFPIRFDFLDTMDGGNLSLQVHPTTEYIQQHFGMPYTQDESYYMLDAAEDASVYLGFRDDIDPEKMIAALHHANKGAGNFDADVFAAKWPVKKHDHVLIPAGTIHCSGKNTMVLEISATPYIFTFKLWDWGRMGSDGKPRPINIEHGKNVLDWNRRTAFTKSELINAITLVAAGDGWKEERTGLHEREFIETRRHWFTKTVLHETSGSVHVLNLVEGREVIVESPDGSFDPFIVHYAETFVVPAQVKSYTIRPHGESEGMECATVKAYVRTGN